MAENTRKVNIVIAASEDGSLAVSVNGANRKLRSIADAARSSGAATSSAFDKTGASINKLQGPLDRFSRQFKNVFNVAIAFEFIRAFSAIEQGLAKVIQLGFVYNGQLETGRLALAGILVSTRQIVENNGEIVPIATAFSAILLKTRQIQQEIAIANITTLGTQTELQEVYQRVLGFSAQQKANDEERLQLAINITNAGKLLGLTQDKLLDEARQILNLENNRGQTILQSLGYTVQELRALKEKGLLVQELNRLLAGYSAIAKDLGSSWEGLVSSAETFISLLAANVFEDFFRGAKNILTGISKELTDSLDTGGLTVFLGKSAKEFEDFGKTIGKVLIAATQMVANFMSSIVDFTSAFGNMFGELRTLTIVFGFFTTGLSTIIQLFGQGAKVAIDFGASLAKITTAGISNFFQTTLLNAINEVIDAFRDLENEGDKTRALLVKLFDGFAPLASNAVDVVAKVVQEIDNLKLSADNWLTLGGLSGGVGILAWVLTRGSIGLSILAAAATAVGALVTWMNEASQQQESQERLGPSIKILEDQRKKFLEIAEAFKEGKIKAAEFLTQVKDIEETLSQIEDNPDLTSIGVTELDVVTVTAKINSLRQVMGKVVGDLLKPISKPSAIEDKIDKGARAALRLGEELTKVKAKLAELDISSTGNPLQFFAAAEAEVMAELENNIEHAHKNAEAIATAHELAAEKMKIAYFDAIKAIIDYEDNLLDKTLAILDNSAKAVEGFNQAQRAGVDNRISVLQTELGIIQQRDGTLERQIELLEEIADLQQTGHQIDIAGATASIALDRAKIAAIQTTIDKLEASLQLYPQIGAGVQEVNDKIAALKAEQQDLANGIDRYGIAIKNSATEMQNLGTVSRNTTNEMKQTVISLRGDVEGFIVDLATSASKGFKGLKDVLSNFSESLTRSFAQGFAKALTAKMNFDVVFKNNFSGLSSFVGGILSSIGSGFQKLFSFISGGSSQASASAASNFSSLGTQVGTDFGQSSVKAANIEWQSGWDPLTNGSGSSAGAPGAASAGTTWGTVFGSIAAAAAGNSFGSAFSTLIGLGKSGASRTGGKVGGTVGGIAGAIGASMLGLPPEVGAAIGSFFGNIIGSFFGSLFEHVKTKGSQIREGVEKWLKEIGVSFADAIDSSNYFFPETKKLADKMFGGDFLAASDEVLRKKAGPELATKLKTLFAFITADAAVKHGKPVEQTGISNANVLLSAIGLDPDVIQDAMDEIIKKGGITFDAMIKKFNELKRGKNISDPFFDEAIKATVDIFYGELPDAIGAAGLAVRTFAEDGTFDLDAFNKALGESITLFEQLSGLTVDILISPTMGTDWEKDFEDSLDELRRKQIASKYLIDNEDRIFAGIDTSNGMSETEWRVYRRNVKAAREDILDLWAAEGLLPEPIEEAADAFADLSDEARRYAEILGNISIDPLQGLQDFEDRKTEIADEIADLQKDIDEINQKIPTMKTLRGKRELIIERDSLQADIDALEKEASQLTVGKALGKSIRNQIADNLRDNIKAAIIDAVITAAIIEPFMEQLNEYIAEALADGVISADELEHMIAMGDTAADKAEAAAERIGPDLEAIDRATDGIRTDLMDGGAALRDIDLSGPVEDSRRIKENLREAHTSVKEAGSSKTGGTQYEAYIGPGGVLRFRPIGPKTPGHAAGGPIAGSGSTDSVPAMLTPGEFVITKAMYAKHRDLVHMIHADKVNHFRSGGMVSNFQGGGEVFGKGGGDKDGGQGDNTWQNILIGLLKDLFGRKTPIDDSLASMQESIHQLQIFLKNVDENWPHLARFKDTALEMIESLKAKMKEALDAILNPVDEFLGSIVGDPVGDIVKQYKELKQSLEDNRKALEASGVDVDSYLKRLAEALPKKIDEAIKAALSFVQDAIDSIQGNIDSLSGLVSDPFQQLADLTDKIAAKRTELLGAKTLEDRSRLSQELSEMLREQLDLAKTPFGESSQDFADLLARNRQEMEDLKAELKKEYDKREKELRDKAPTIVVEVLTPLKLKREDSKEFAESLEKSLNSDRRVIKRVEKIAEHVRRIGH